MMQTTSPAEIRDPTSTNGGAPGVGARYIVPTMGASIGKPLWAARSSAAGGAAAAAAAAAGAVSASAAAPTGYGTGPEV